MLDRLITREDIPKVNWDEVEKIPEFQRLNESGYHSYWHREGSTMNHTKLVVEACQEYIKQNPNEFDYDEKFLLVAVSLFHDIGKGVTAKLKEDGNWSANDHDVEGERLTRFLLWDVDFTLRESISLLVKYHMTPKYFRYKKEEPGAIEKIVTEIARNSDCRLLYYINLFDVMGAISDEREIEIQHCETLKQYAEQLGVWGKTEDRRDIVAISAGYSHTVGLKANGTVVSDIAISKLEKNYMHEAIHCFWYRCIGAGKSFKCTEVIIKNTPELFTVFNVRTLQELESFHNSEIQLLRTMHDIVESKLEEIYKKAYIIEDVLNNGDELSRLNTFVDALLRVEHIPEKLFWCEEEFLMDLKKNEDSIKSKSTLMDYFSLTQKELRQIRDKAEYLFLN